MKKGKGWRYNLRYYAFLSLWTVLSPLPMWLHYFIADCLYVLFAYVLRYRKRVIDTNLQNAYPDLTDKQRLALRRKFYHHFCDIIAETVKFATISRKNIMRRMTFEGTEQIEEILRSGQPIALMLGHYGNWEWVTSFALWLPNQDHICLGQIYHPLENSAFNDVLLRVRNRLGSLCVPTDKTLRWVIENKQMGNTTMLGYINDQVPLWQNIHHWLNFLNQETPVFTGIERIARKQNQAVVYLEMTCPRRGYYKCQFQVMTRDPASLPEYAITNEYFHRLEQTINRAPQYWLWSHNRWKRTREEFNRRFVVRNGKVIEVVKE